MNKNKVSVRTITPAQAVQMLAMNDGNRAMRMSYVRYLARQLRDGNWQLSTDAVALREDGRIGNGQHRLQAIVHADMPAEVLFIEGLTDASFRILDIGLKRSAADALCITSTMAADCALIARLLNRDVSSRVSNEVLGDILAWWSPIHDTLHAAGGAGSKGLANAAVRIGVGVQWASQLQSDAAYVLTQYGAFMGNDTPAMSRAVATQWKRLSRDFRKLRSQPERVAMAASVWYCFDPKRAAVEPLIKRPEEVLAALKAQILKTEAKAEKEAQAELAITARVPAMQSHTDWRHTPSLKVGRVESEAIGL